MGFTRKELKRFSKKELIALAREHDFGFKVKTSMNKPIIVEHIFKSKQFSKIKSTLTKKQKRPRTEAQKAAFEKMTGRKRSKEETIVESKEDLITDSNNNDMAVPEVNEPEIIKTQKISDGVPKKIPPQSKAPVQPVITTDGQVKLQTTARDPREIGIDAQLLGEEGEAVKELIAELDLQGSGFFQQQLLKREQELGQRERGFEEEKQILIEAVETTEEVLAETEEKLEEEMTVTSELRELAGTIRQLNLQREEQRRVIARLRQRIEITEKESEELNAAITERDQITAELRRLESQSAIVRQDLLGTNPELQEMLSTTHIVDDSLKL